MYLHVRGFLTATTGQLTGNFASQRQRYRRTLSAALQSHTSPYAIFVSYFMVF